MLLVATFFAGYSLAWRKPKRTCRPNETRGPQQILARQREAEIVRLRGLFDSEPVLVSRDLAAARMSPNGCLATASRRSCASILGGRKAAGQLARKQPEAIRPSSWPAIGEAT
jgi:hypothetical protein